MADANLELKISLARAGLAGDAAAAARTIKSNLDNLKVDLEIDDKSVNLAKRAIDELGDETLQTAKQAEFLRNAYNLNDDEINKVIAKMGQLERSTKDAKREGGALQEVFTGFLRRVGESAFQGLISAVQRLGQAVSDTVRGAVAGFADFERAITQAGVISGSIGTEDFEALNEEVGRLGIVTSKTQTEIGQTTVNLSRAGFTASETTQSIEALARASEATGETMDVVGDIVAKTYRTFQNQFDEAGMSAREASNYIANALVQTANSTNTTITSIGESLAYAGPQAAAANQDLGELLVLIGLLGDTGKQGSAAGTGLAEMLARLKTASAAGASEFGELAKGSKRAVEAFNEIGTEVRNTDGSMKGLLDIIPSIKEKLSTLEQTDQDLLTKVLFGTQGEGSLVPLLNVTEERLAAVNELITETSQEGEGAAMRGGKAMLDSFSGSLDLIEGSLQKLQIDFGAALAPGLEAIVRQATEIVNTLLGIDGLFDPLTEASQRFAVALGGSQEVAGSLTDQIVNFTEVAIEQLASVIDAVTAFISTEGNVTQMAGAFEDLASVLRVLATVANVVIALADGIGSLKTQAEGLPIIGENVERWLNWPTPLNALVEAFRAVGSVFVALKDIVVNAIDGMLERVGKMLPVLNPLIDKVQGILGRLASTPDLPDTSNVTAIDTYQEEDGPDNRNPNRPSVSTRTAAPPSTTPPPPPTPTEPTEPTEPPEFTALTELEDKYRALTTTLETEQANQTRALVEGGKSREEIATKERDFFQRRIRLNEQKLGELRAIDQSGLSPEDQAKVQQTILDLDRQLANDRLKLAEDSRKAQEDAAAKAAKAEQDATRERIRNAENNLSELRRLQSSGSLSPEDAAKTAAQIAQIEADLAKEQTTLSEQTTRERERADQAAIKSAEDAAEARIKAEEEAAQAAEEAHQERLRQAEEQMDTQEALAQIELEVAATRLAALDRVAEGLERQQALLQAQGDLAQSVFDLETSLADARREQLNEVLGDEEASQSEKKKAARELLRLTQEQFAREKEALEAKQALELQQFDLSQQQAALAEQRGIREQELALKRLELQRLEIANEITLARLRGDDAAVAIGEQSLGLLGEQIAAQQDYIGSLRESAALSDELAAGQRDALVANQAQQDINLANQQQDAASGVADQLREADLGSGIDRRADRLENRADRNLRNELGQGRTALADLERQGINPQARDLASQPTVPTGGALPGANFAQPIVTELQNLGGAINALAASPRQLTVQTPDPVADTGQILSDISRAQTAGVNP